jgi:hypothetical protein
MAAVAITTISAFVLGMHPFPHFPFLHLINKLVGQGPTMMHSKFLVVFSLCIVVSILQATATLGRLPRRRLLLSDDRGHLIKHRYGNDPYFYSRHLQDTEAAKTPVFDSATTSTSAEAARATAGTAERTTTKAMTFASPTVVTSAMTTETTPIRDGDNYGFGNGFGPFSGNYGAGFFPSFYSSDGGGYGYPGNGYPGNFGFGFPGNFGYESSPTANSAMESFDTTKPGNTKAPST